MKLVLDTDVVLSGLRSPAGASRRVLLAIRKREVRMCASVGMFLEYEAVLKRSSHLAAIGLTAGEVDQILDGLAALSEPVSPSFLWRPALKDPDDEMFLEAAVSARADALVTFNRKDYLPEADLFGLRIARPGELAEELGWRR